MLRLLLALAATMLAVLPMTLAAPAAADPYGPSVSIDTRLDVGSDGEVVAVTITARANVEGLPPRGRVAVEITADASVTAAGGQSVLQEEASRTALAKTVFSATVAYDGSPVTLEVGKLPAGEYDVEADFTPAPTSNYLPSDGRAGFTIGADGLPVEVTDSAQPTAATTGGVLPDTGGPGTWWLLLGGVLLAGGAGSVYYARRRTATS